MQTYEDTKNKLRVLYESKMSLNETLELLEQERQKIEDRINEIIRFINGSQITLKRMDKDISNNKNLIADIKSLPFFKNQIKNRTIIIEAVMAVVVMGFPLVANMSALVPAIIATGVLTSINVGYNTITYNSIKKEFEAYDLSELQNKTKLDTDNKEALENDINLASKEKDELNIHLGRKSKEKHDIKMRIRSIDEEIKRYEIPHRPEIGKLR